MMTLEPTAGSASADVLASSTCRPAPAWATSTCIFLFAEYWNALLIVSMGVSEASSPGRNTYEHPSVCEMSLPSVIVLPLPAISTAAFLSRYNVFTRNELPFSMTRRLPVIVPPYPM